MMTLVVLSNRNRYKKRRFDPFMDETGNFLVSTQTYFPNFGNDTNNSDSTLSSFRFFIHYLLTPNYQKLKGGAAETTQFR